MKKLFVFLVISSITISNSQLIKSFSKDDDKFIKEMNSFLGNTDKQQAKEIMDEFKEIWELYKFTDVQRKIIHTTCNRMLEKKCRPYPHFSTYLRSLIAYSKTEMNNDNFENWRKGLSSMLKNRKVNIRIIDNYLKTSEGLWTSNSIYKSANTEWRASSDNFKYVFDGKNIQIIFGEIDLTCYAKRDSATIYKHKEYTTL